MMTVRLASSVLLPVVLAVSPAVGVNAQSGAKALFHGPAGSTANPYGPVGIHYWFENDQGTRFTQARDAGAGARLRLHIRSNTGGFLTAWMIDGSDEGIQLTATKEQWAGHQMEARRDYVVPGEILVPASGKATRLLILFARAQMEQVATAAGAREKIRRLSLAIARDGGFAIVQETDTSTPGQVGTYVVHREGAQPGVEIDIERVFTQTAKEDHRVPHRTELSVVPLSQGSSYFQRRELYYFQGDRDQARRVTFERR